MNLADGESQDHQAIRGELHGQLWQFLKGKPCKVFSAPFDVRLNADSRDDTVVQPDLLVVCDKSKLNGKSCVGAPDFVIEILSNSTARLDTFVKFRLYQRAGVREYWIVNPETRTVQVCSLENGRYVVNVYGDTDVVAVSALGGCRIDLADVFGE